VSSIQSLTCEHSFSDISVSAYAAALNMHTRFENSEVDVTIVVPKQVSNPVHPVNNPSFRAYGC